MRISQSDVGFAVLLLMVGLPVGAYLGLKFAEWVVTKVLLWMIQ